ncbi:winged helix-turn-helix domain-containing protein [Klebsiella quasipneumoniae]|uniref:winged helix-turn-helix domain-containing protein n=1 Tax=Klebsiella quasipneumoniae TaxID=1463165 RepID=UPI0015F085D1|nr:winged helix-turn-helix domain-containing protein [Klebsiella quasipneumoniae]
MKSIASVLNWSGKDEESMNKAANLPTILVVNISDDFKALIDEAIRYINCGVLLCNNKRTLANIRKKSPAFVLIQCRDTSQEEVDLCKEIRSVYDLPIVMIAEKSKETTRLAAFESGVDDYITGVLNPKEIAWRLKAILRRCPAVKALVNLQNAFLINKDTQQVSIGGVVLDITRCEYRILFMLSSRPGRVFKREQLCRCLYKEKRDSSRTVDSHIKNLRAKLSAVDPDIQFIKSTYGLGYSWEYEPAHFI